MAISDKAIEATGQKIRALWCSEMCDFDLRNTGRISGWGKRHITRWDGGVSAAGRFYKPVWPKIAAFCLDNELEPAQLVRAMFYRKMIFAPNPSAAIGAKALEQYKSYTTPLTVLEIKTSIIHALESQKSRATSSVLSLETYYKLDQQTAWRRTITSRDEPLSPLFRYVVAKNQSWEDLAPMYEAAAYRQFNRHPELYLEVWGDWIPNEMRAKEHSI